eukprot:m.47814 g.47814  ORF g.47814 m.47814 type:complete len:704 (+) comp13246_c0_seq1:68-2179(+)
MQRLFILFNLLWLSQEGRAAYQTLATGPAVDWRCVGSCTSSNPNNLNHDVGSSVLAGCSNSRFATKSILASPATAPLRVSMNVNRVVKFSEGDLDLQVRNATTSPTGNPCTFDGMSQDDTLATYSCTESRSEEFVLVFHKLNTCGGFGTLEMSNISIQAFQCPAADIGGVSLPASYATVVVDGLCQTGDRADSETGAPRYRCQAGVGWTLVGGRCIPVTSNPSNGKDSGSSGSNNSTGVVVGAVVGSLLLLVLVALFLRSKHKHRRVPANFFQEGGKGGLVENFTMNLHYKDIQKQFTRQGDYEDPSNYEDPSQVLALLKHSEAMQLPSSAVEMTQEAIGSGAFGEVFHGRFTYNNQTRDCAIKTLHPTAQTEDKLDFLKEAAIMAQFNHPNVLSLLAIVTDKQPNMIIMELMVKGSLLGLFDKHSDEIDETRLLIIAQDIAQGMAYLSNRGFVHRDLAARNVLVAHDYTCRVSDFGLSKEIDGEYYLAKAGKIPIRWTALEALFAGKYTTSSDVWSYGITLWEVFSKGDRPYGDMPNRDVTEYVQNGNRMKPPPNCPLEIYNLMLGCWQEDRRARPSFDDIVSSLTSISARAGSGEALTRCVHASTKTARSIAHDPTGYLVPNADPSFRQSNPGTLDLMAAYGGGNLDAEPYDQPNPPPASAPIRAWQAPGNYDNSNILTPSSSQAQDAVVQYDNTSFGVEA